MNDLIERITDYLVSGGLFNPELAEHDKVRNLLVDCREALLPQISQTTSPGSNIEFYDGEPWDRQPKPTTVTYSTTSSPVRFFAGDPQILESGHCSPVRRFSSFDYY